MDILKRLKSITPNFQKNLLLLFISSEIRGLGSSMLNIFGVIFIYTNFGNSIILSLLYYIIASLVFVIVAPWGAKLISLLSLKKSIIIGGIFFVLTNITFIFWPQDLLFWMFVNIVCLTLSKVFFWVPFHIDLATFTSEENRGLEISLIKSMAKILGIITPIFSGLIIKTSGFTGIFIISSILYLLSIIPLLKIEDIKIDYKYDYIKTFKKCFSKAYIKDFMMYLLEGAEKNFSLVLWPIIIVSIIDHNFTLIGIITSVSYLIAFGINLIINKIFKKKRESVIKAGIYLYSFGWFFKAISTNAIGVFFSSIYHSISESLMKTNYDSYSYEREYKKGDHMDEYEIIRDIAENIGRAISGILLIILIVYVNPEPKEFLFIGAICFILIALILGNKTKAFKSEENQTHG